MLVRDGKGARGGLEWQWKEITASEWEEGGMGKAGGRWEDGEGR